MAPARLTVFHLNGERSWRGGERQLLYLATGLRARGHRNVVCCRAESELAARARSLDLEVMPLPFWFEFDPLSAWQVVRSSKSRDGAVVHAHTGHASGIALVARWLGGPPAVAHRRVSLPLRRFSRVKYARMHGIIAVSRQVAGTLAAQGLDQARLAVVYDGIPTTAEEAGWVGSVAPSLGASAERRPEVRRAIGAKHSIDPHAKWVGTLAALTPDKDHRTLLAAARRVVDVEPSVRFVLAGQGPEEAALQGLISELNLQGKVVLLGQVADPGPLLQSLDLLVVSSRSEGLGSVVLEAAAAGVPVVATAVGGIPELVVHQETGFLAPPGDPASLAAEIVAALRDERLRREVAGRAQAGLARFSLSALAEQTEAVYRAALARS